MNQKLLAQIRLLNPWLEDPKHPILNLSEYRQRQQTNKLILKEWDKQWILLIGPRRAGKTTLGKYLCHELMQSKRFKETLYLNCDYDLIRQNLDSPLVLKELLQIFELEKPIVFIDEVQRLPNPGLLLKAIADLQLPIKMIASGSSQLEIRSKVQEFLTGRQISATILPLSCIELGKDSKWEEQALYGSYPDIITSSEKIMQLGQLYDAYIKKDIVELLKIGKPDVMQKLLSLVAHSSGQLVNYQQLATDCKTTIPTVQHYLDILVQTFILQKLPPFVGNKRTEITSNPVYYFIDNGLRNYALNNFTPLQQRGDKGLLVESYVFQEIWKHMMQAYLGGSLHFWRTKSGAEVDFIYYRNPDECLPIEVKFQELTKPVITKGYRSFLEAYRPKQGIIINRTLSERIHCEGTAIQFIRLDDIEAMLALLSG